jgi:hypothetical protein
VRSSLEKRVEARKPKPPPAYAPPPTARETFEAEWKRRGRRSLAADDQGLYILKLEPSSSWERSSCDDFDLSEDQLRIYFTKAKMSRFYEINYCSVRGVLRDKGVYKWWIVNVKGYGTMSVDASASAGQNEGEYLFCEECPVAMNW